MSTTGTTALVPEFVVGNDPARRILHAPLRGVDQVAVLARVLRLLERARLCFGQDRLVGEGRRPLEGRDGAEVPEALQIVLTVGCPRRRPCLGGRRTGGHGDSQYDREREHSRAHASLRCCPEG